MMRIFQLSELKPVQRAKRRAWYQQWIMAAAQLFMLSLVTLLLLLVIPNGMLTSTLGYILALVLAVATMTLAFQLAKAVPGCFDFDKGFPVKAFTALVLGSAVVDWFCWQLI